MSRKFLLLLTFLFLLSLGTALAFWPVNRISIRLENGETVFSGAIPEGWSFTSRLVHSLEKTPVEDEFRVVGGKIWQWEERFRSNNAGLPTVIPSNGRFLSTPGWFIVRGGRNHWDCLVYRVGNSFLGRNTLTLEGLGEIRVFETLAGERLLFEVNLKPWRPSSRVLRGPDLR